MTHDFDKDFSFSVTDDAHALVRRACHRLVRDCTGVTRSTPAEDRRGVDYWVSTPRGRIGLDLKLRRKDYGAKNGGATCEWLDVVFHHAKGGPHGVGGFALAAEPREGRL